MYYFYDEWSMIYIGSHFKALDGMTTSFNGHLWMMEYWIYRIQVSVFGLDSRFFISACFVVAIVALHLSIAAVLRACDLPRQLSLMIGGLLAYLGCASQNFIFTVQVSLVLSMAAGLFGAAIVLRNLPSTRAIVGTGLCLLASSVLASGVAIGVVAFAGVIAAIRWRWAAVSAVAPAAIVLVWWFTTAELGEHYPAALGDRVSFASRLLLQSVGAVAGNERAVGAMLSGVAMTLIVVALVCRWLDKRAVTLLVAGIASAIVTAAAIAQSRAGIRGFNFENFNRYLSYVAIPLTLAAAPALVAVVRNIPFGKRQTSLVRAVPAGAVAIAFILGLSTASSYTELFEVWNVQTRHDVVAATLVINEGCPSGVAPDPASFPTSYNPQLTTQLLRELVERGALSIGPTEAADPVVTARMCPEV